MPEMLSKQPRFTYSGCGPFTKNKERILKFKEIWDSRYLHKNELDKTCFQHDIAYRDFKDLAKKKTASDKVLKDKVFRIPNNPKYDGYQRGLAFMVYKFFDRKSTGSGVSMLANKSVIKNEAKSAISWRITQTKKEEFSHHLKTVFRVLT